MSVPLIVAKYTPNGWRNIEHDDDSAAWFNAGHNATMSRTKAIPEELIVMYVSATIAACFFGEDEYYRLVADALSNQRRFDAET